MLGIEQPSPYPILLTLCVQYTKTQTVKKWLPFVPICAVYLEYIVTIHFVRPYPNLLTLYVQYTKTLAVKKWLPFELICAVYLEYIVTIHFVRPYPNLLTLYVQYTKTLAVKKWLPFELICAVYIVTLNSSPVRPCPFWVRTDTGAIQVIHPYNDSVCLA